MRNDNGTHNTRTHGNTSQINPRLRNEAQSVVQASGTIINSSLSYSIMSALETVSDVRRQRVRWPAIGLACGEC